ncbi:MAG: sugar ABC transporter permease [Propionibacteriaceae bacterium]|jgi:raffinose/stachyose/melibiose transport system permease protein|nr:sugar ABC transporter permease [Propionibacteriaceae bacterium]
MTRKNSAGVGLAQTRTGALVHSRYAPWIFAVPAVIVILVLRYVPSLVGGAYAFTNWDGTSLNADFVGLRNFVSIFTDPTTSGALWHTLFLAGAYVVATNAIGMALAVALKKTLKTRSLLRALFFLPFALSQLATAYIWQFIFAYNGPINYFLDKLHLESLKHTWLGEPGVALVAILVVMIWQYTGMTMVIYMAGLEGIPEELHEAAMVDGAGPWKRFRHITFPLLAPALTTSCTLTLVFGLGVFDQIIALTNGGPSSATETIATQVFKQTFVYGFFGEGSAMAVLFAALVTLFAIIQMLILRRREERLDK